MCHLIAEAAAPVAERLLREAYTDLSDEEFERLADEIADIFAANVDPAVPVLSADAISREGIYADHP